MFNETFYVCRKFAAALEVPEGDAAELIIIVPVVEELLDAVLAGLVLGLLRIREFEGRDAAYLERLDVGVVASAGDGVGLAGDAQLLGLSASQSSSLLPLHSSRDFRPRWGNLWAPPLLFRRRPPQSNCPPGTVPGKVFPSVRSPTAQGWYPNIGSR